MARRSLVESDEDVDQKGLVKRKRINNQTIFDQMMIDDLIELPQHESAHRFMNDLSVSGTSIPSVDVEAFGGSPLYKKGDSLSEKRMIFSNAFRFMTGRHDQEDIKLVMSYCHNPYNFKLNSKELDALSKAIGPCLWSLAKFYGIERVRDPRRIIRSQVYQNR